MSDGPVSSRPQTPLVLSPLQQLVLQAHIELDDQEPGRLWSVEEVAEKANEILVRRARLN